MRILAEIEASKADILGLTEMDKIHAYAPELKALGYEIVVYSHECDKPNGPLFTPCLAVKRDKFTILKVRTVAGNMIVPKYDDKSAEFKKEHKGCMKQRGEITLLTLKHNETGKIFVFGYAHTTSMENVSFVKHA
jgi:hypothetical protein